jgi:hypothetical protein
MGGIARGAGPANRAGLFHAHPRGKAFIKKHFVAGLLDAIIARARDRGLIDEQSQLAAIDSTGLEASHVSSYFAQRCRRKYHRFPKFWAVIDAARHLCLSIVPGVGPSPDDPRFHQAAQEAHDRHGFKALAGDCGFDGEHHQQFLYERLGVLGIIPPIRGRPAHDPKHIPGGFYRAFWHKHWPKKLYGQRWQVESFFSMLKRLLDSFLRARRRWSQHREMCLKAITLNLMILAVE